MIYFDSGATTLQKPHTVQRAMLEALTNAANPGRSGHKPAMKAADIVFKCREALCELFSVAEPQRIVFTLNATHALNIAIKSVMRDGGHAVISGYEHNSVVRPLEAMRCRGVSYSVAHSPLFDSAAVLKSVKDAICDETRCVIINHVSNVFGFVLPIMEIDMLCEQRGIPLIVDASQSAGVVGIDVSQFRATAFICMPGHKGLYGPQGTGVLICCKDDSLYSLLEGGTGSNSLSLTQPEFLPDIFESGTLNVPGIAGLNEGVKFVIMRTTSAICDHERHLVRKLASLIGNIEGMRVYYDDTQMGGALSVRHNRLDPDSMASRLAENGICMRSGLHCAPLAHRSAGTLPDGTLRLSLSAFNTVHECERTAQVMARIVKSD